MPLKHIKWITGLSLFYWPFHCHMVWSGTVAFLAFHNFPPLGEYDFSLSPWRTCFPKGNFTAGLKLDLNHGHFGAPVLALWLAPVFISLGLSTTFFFKDRKLWLYPF